MKIFRAPYSIAILLLICMAMMAACTTDTYYADDYRNCDREFGLQEADPDTDEEYSTDTVRSLEGGFNLASFLEPVKLEIGSLDKDLEKQESVTARIERNRIDFTYKVKEMLFTEPFVEFDLTCRFRDSKDTTEMQFRSIAKLSDKNARNISLYRLLESEYLKKLVQKEGESFDLARKHTHQAIHDLLDPEVEFKYGIGNAPYGSDTLETFAYLYGLFFMQDMTFYKNFKKLSKAVGGEKKWDEVLSRKKISDKLIEHYRLEQSQCDTTVRNELKKDIDWTLLRYDMARRIVGDTLTCADTASVRDTVDVPDTTAKDTAKADTLPSLVEIFGECSLNREHQKVMLDTGKYFECLEGEWTPIRPPTYYGDRGKEGDIIIRDGEYFVCGGDYYWRLLKDDEIVPPVKELRKCRRNEVAQYGNTFYRCDILHHRWYELPEDSLFRYQKNDVLCADSTEGRIEQVGGSFWTCSDLSWTKVWYSDSVVYAFNLAHGDECKNGPKGTSVHWNEAISREYSRHAYLVCDGQKLEWNAIDIVERNNYEAAVFDGGIFVDDSTFRTTNGDFTYTIRKRAEWAGLFDVVGVEADIGGKEYGAFFRSKVPYLSSKRGVDSVAIDSITVKSASFDSFIAQYVHAIGPVPLLGVMLMRVGEGSYMDWETASGFCPEGYHVPDTSEWANGGIEKFASEERYSYDSPLKLRDNGTTFRYDIYWTSVSKDSGTHYCFEIHYEGNTGPLSRTVECPDDLYPGVQTLCFKDREEE